MLSINRQRFHGPPLRAVARHLYNMDIILSEILTGSYLREVIAMQCALCKKEVTFDKYFSRKSICPKCGGDLHICLNCRFYSESSHNKCLEPKAEFQRTRDRANFCDFFVFRQAPAASSTDSEKEAARKKLDDLFRK